MPTKTPSPLMTALDALWDHIRDAVPQLPSAHVLITPGRPRSDHGWGRWTRLDSQTASGLTVSTATLSAGATDVLEAMLHDAAHMLNWTRGVEDTTSRGLYHTQAYLVAAEDVGLVWPEGKPRAGSRGYATPELTDATLHRHAEDLAALEQYIPQELPVFLGPRARAPRTEARLTLLCSCSPEPRRMRMGRTIFERGPVLCGLCGKEFKPE